MLDLIWCKEISFCFPNRAGSVQRRYQATFSRGEFCLFSYHLSGKSEATTQYYSSLCTLTQPSYTHKVRYYTLTAVTVANVKSSSHLKLYNEFNERCLDLNKINL